MYLTMIQVRDSNNTHIEFPNKDLKTAQINGQLYYHTESPSVAKHSNLLMMVTFEITILAANV